MTGDLSDDRGDLLVEREVAVLDQKPSDPPEIDGREEVLQVKVENPAAVSVLTGVGDDRLAALEAVRGSVVEVSGRLDLLLAILKEVGQFPLEFFSFSVGALIVRCPPDRFGISNVVYLLAGGIL